eukprot:TRINITY_DN3410_c0_g1_i3.p1 TRINITY_DN3410_c0_g1~~TRINITY_DN3410_c0_g1_i3.p1  ORF type:complete len:526 (-),score=162.74 TRINITY_DN3410_c0_g1_i3:199-1776(-)
MQKPAQIIVIPQNMLSKQSLNILKQRQVLPNTKQILPQQQMKPLATVIGNTTAVNGRPIMAVPPVSVSQPQQQLILPSPPVSPPLKRSLSPASSEISNDEMAGQGLVDVKVEDGDENYQPSRKRANLDHLSAEEKLQRRKLKNRVAAQNARDKKKAYIDELEIHLENLRQAKLQVEEERARLAKENDHLNTINSRLSLENTRLMERNLELEKRLGLETTVISATNDASYILPCSPQSLPSRTPSPPYGNNDAIEFSDDIKSNLYNLQDSSSHLLVAATDAANAAVDTTASTVILDTCPEPAAGDRSPDNAAAAGENGSSGRPHSVINAAEEAGAAGGHSVVVPRLDDLVTELLHECSDDENREQDTSSSATGCPIVMASQPHIAPSCDVNTTFMPSVEEFQYLKDIDVIFGDTDNNNNKDGVPTTWQTPAATAASTAEKTEQTAVGNSFTTTTTTGPGLEQLVITNNTTSSPQQQDTQQQIVAEASTDDLIFTPTAEKMLDEIWLENSLNQEADDCFDRMFPELD